MARSMSSANPRILVTGGTGTLGRAFVDAASSKRQRLSIMSRSEPPRDLPAEREWTRADLVTGEGLETAVEGVDVILHAATDPTGEPEAVDVEGTRRLLDAAQRAGVRHLIYPSIVGIDHMPYSYYEAKLKAEGLVADAEVPHTTVRITQFHSFVDELLSSVGKLPIMPLPTRARIQSIAVEDAAGHLVQYLQGAPAGEAPHVAGPEILTLGEMARTWCRLRKKRRWIVRLPLPGELLNGFREGRATAPDRRIGSQTWDEWLGRSQQNGDSRASGDHDSSGTNTRPSR